MSTSKSNVPLVEVITALRADLVEAQKGLRSDLQLEMGEIEVELQAVVTKEGTAKAKIEILNIAKLLGLGGAEAELSGKLASVATQKIKLKLKPITIDPETGGETDTRVADEDDY